MSKATKVWALIAGTLIAACDSVPTSPFETADAELASAEVTGGTVAGDTGVRGGGDAGDRAHDRQRPGGDGGDETRDRQRPERGGDDVRDPQRPERDRPNRDQPERDRPERDRPGDAGDRRHPDRWRPDAERPGRDDHGLEARARAAIAEALDLYGRIAEEVERDDRPALKAALADASTAIDQAIDAYDAGDFSRALVKANQAIDILSEIARVLG